MKTNYTIFIILLFVIVVTPKEVFAYLDPGTGSFIIQMIAASIVGVSLAFKTVRRYVTTVFNKIFSRKKNNSKEDV